MLQHGRFHFRSTENSDTAEGRDLMAELDEFKAAKTKLPKFSVKELPPLTELETGEGRATRIAEERIAKYANALNYHGADYNRPTSHYKGLRLAALVENMFVDNDGKNPIHLPEREVNSLHTKYNMAAGKQIKAVKFLKILNEAETRRNLPALTVPFVNDRGNKRKDAHKWAKEVLASSKSAAHALRMMKHGFFNYGRDYMMGSSAYKEAIRTIAKQGKVFRRYGHVDLRNMSLSSVRLDPLSFIEPDYQTDAKQGWRSASAMALNWNPTPAEIQGKFKKKLVVKRPRKGDKLSVHLSSPQSPRRIGRRPDVASPNKKRRV